MHSTLEKNIDTTGFRIEEDKIRVLFAGTGNIAPEILASLLKIDQFEVVGILTQPDRPVGRKQIITPPPIIEFVQEIYPDLNIPTYQPDKLKEEYQSILNEAKPELIVVAAYGQIIPKEMLDYPKYKAVNIHGSILPNLRGAVPVQMAIKNGYKTTGVTIQLMSEGMDEGDILGVDHIDIAEDERTDTLMKKVSIVGEKLCMEILPKWTDGKITPVQQDHTTATYCYQKDIKKEKAEINFETMTATEIDQLIRAFYPWPIGWFKLGSNNIKNESVHGKVLKIYHAKLHSHIEELDIHLGELKRYQKGLYLGAREGVLELLEVQLEGKKRMEGKNYFFLI